MTSISSLQSSNDNPLLRVPRDHKLEFKDFMSRQMKLPESDTRWRAMCESIQRQAHGFDAAFGSAYAHMVATPKSERMDPREAPRTAFIFVDDPNDSNRYGHVVGKWDVGTGSLEGIPVVTNDVSDSEGGYDPGNVTVVPLGWFPRHWGDAIQFATTWFGGDEIPTFTPAPPESGKEDTAEWVQVAIERARVVKEMMRKAIRDNNDITHPAHERALRRELAHQQSVIDSLKQLLP